MQVGTFCSVSGILRKTADDEECEIENKCMWKLQQPKISQINCHYHFKCEYTTIVDFNENTCEVFLQLNMSSVTELLGKTAACLNLINVI